MKVSSRFAGVAASFALVAVLVSVVGTSSAAPSSTSNVPKTAVSGPQAKPPVAPGSRDAKLSASLGATAKLAASKESSKDQVTTLAGNVSTVDFATPLNYCYRSLTYMPLKNNTSSTQYAHLYFYTGGMTRDYYVSIPANGTVYPAFYGTEGSWSSSLYIWNGSSYVYDEYKSGSNTCNVSVTRTYNAAGYVQLKIQNLGTAYATQRSSELAPFPTSGTYTGTHYDYPVAGGAAIYRWFYVGTSPYGIMSTTQNSYLSPVVFSGDL